MIRRIRELTLAYARRFPHAPRIVIGDISRKGGGYFPGHASHQQGLDADIYFPRADNAERSPIGGGINYYRARWLIIRIARHPSTQIIYAGAGLSSVHGKVVYYPGHETHLHMRIRQ
jgi:murein endopeptidase